MPGVALGGALLEDPVGLIDRLNLRRVRQHDGQGAGVALARLRCPGTGTGPARCPGRSLGTAPLVALS